MPLRDPDKRRAYEAEQARKRRARLKQERQQAASADQSPPSLKTPNLPLTKGPMGQLAEIVANLTPVEWTNAKARLAATILQKAEQRLLTMPVDSMTPADVLRYVQAGVVLMQAVQAEEGERRERRSETFDLAAAVLKHPRARDLVLELSRLSRELRAQGELAS